MKSKFLNPLFEISVLLGLLLAGEVTRLHAQTVEQIRSMQLAFDQIIHSGSYPDPSSARQSAQSLTGQYGREGTATLICATARTQSLKSSQENSLRLIGNQIQPEFTGAILVELQNPAEPIVTARLLRLFRNVASVPIAPELRTRMEQSISSFLSDVRTADTLTVEGDAQGGLPLRVCDIAFNVLQEVRVRVGAATQLSHFQSFEDRDAKIAEFKMK